MITAIYGGFDTLKPQAPQDIDVDWVCFTDDTTLQAAGPWRVIVAEPQYAHPCMAAKVHKCLPPALPSVWIDASVEITSPRFARQALASVHDGIAVYRHPRRDCIYAEAEASLGAEGQDGKYAALPIREQIAAYQAEGYPDHEGLYACGIIARSADVDERLGRAWLAECERWGYQDQLSFPVVCRRLGITPGVFTHSQIRPGDDGGRGYLQNPWMRIHPHLK